MNKIFEILKEERERILNLHEDRTKSHYLSVISEDVAQLQARAKACGWSNYSSESGVSSPDVEGYKNSGWECPKGSGKKPNPKQPKQPQGTTATETPTKETPVPQKQVSTQPNLNQTTVMSIQNLLKGKGMNLGTSGPKKDGVDGVLGNTTLKAIESALNKTSTPTPQTQEPTQTIPTLPKGTVQRPGQPTQLAGQKR